tara:strand:+ start:6517 stop:6786 length:270 start_codon:yes stop_codon:yes gene_type:complete
MGDVFHSAAMPIIAANVEKHVQKVACAVKASVSQIVQRPHQMSATVVVTRPKRISIIVESAGLDVRDVSFVKVDNVLVLMGERSVMGCV